MQVQFEGVTGAKTILQRTDNYLEPDWGTMDVKRADLAENPRVVSVWYFHLAGEPAKYVAILGFQQALIIVELSLTKAGNLGLGKTAKKEIHFAHAAMPGAKQYTPLPGAERRGVSLRTSHVLRCRN
jgi:hypothetical protein